MHVQLRGAVQTLSNHKFFPHELSRLFEICENITPQNYPLYSILLIVLVNSIMSPFWYMPSTLTVLLNAGLSRIICQKVGGMIMSLS